MDVGRLVADEDAAWRELRDVLDRMTLEQLERPGLTPDGWSVKDAMFHIGAWMADCAGQLERMRMGTFQDRVDTVEDIERQNREWFELSRTLDLATVRTELIAARTWMLHEFAALADVIPSAWEWFEESGPIHYRKHVGELQAWADRP